MSAIDTFRAPTGVRAPALGAKLKSMLSGWNDARVTRNALYRLSDRELTDIGLSRGDIDAVARRR